MVQLLWKFWSNVEFRIIKTAVFYRDFFKMSSDSFTEIFHVGSTAEHLELFSLRFWVFFAEDLWGKSRTVKGLQ